MSARPSGPEAVRVRVTRDLGLFDVTMAAIGAMVGAAIFLLVGPTFAVAGPLTFLGIAAAAVAALLAGLAYAEFASGRTGASGGAYAWVSAVLPAPSGFLAGWLSLAGHIAASALGALGLGIFFVELVRPSGVAGPLPLEARFIAVGVLVVSAALHFARIHTSSRTLGRVTLVRVILISSLAIIGVASYFLRGGSQGAGSVAQAPGLLSLALGAGLFFIAFQGFETIAQLSDHLKKPERNVPRGILLAVAGSLGLYLLFFVAILGNAPAGSLSGWPDCSVCGPNSVDLVFLGVSNFLLGEPWVLEVFLIIGIISMFGALNANLTSGIKTSVNMARDGLLPRALAEVRGREVPPAAVAATTGLAAVMLLVLSLEVIVIVASLAFLLLFAFVHAAVVTSRVRERRTPAGSRKPIVAALSVLAIPLNLAIGVSLLQYPGGAGAIATFLGLLWLAVGLIFHWFAGGRKRMQPSPAPTKADVTGVLTTAEDAVELERYRVFLPLRTFEDAELVEFGARVARARGGELSLLHVVEIPRNLPPKAIRFRYMDSRIRGLEKLADVGERIDVDTRAVVKIGYKVYEIILDTTREEAVNLLVLGWRGGRLEGERRILGSNIDYLIENAPCDVVVYKTQGFSRPMKRIVVLMSPIWTLGGIDELALVAAEEDHPVIEILSLARDREEADRLKAEAAAFLKRCVEAGLEVEHKILYATAWESVALQESAGASLLMLRATSPGGLRKFALSPVEDRIVKLAKCPVLILRQAAG